MALNTYPQAANPAPWRAAMDKAVRPGRGRRDPGRPGPDAIRRAAPPQLRLHLSVQGSATNADAINFYREGSASCAPCCRACWMEQVQRVIDNTPVEIEVFGFGSLCVMVEGAAPRPT
jgi:putative protease